MILLEKKVNNKDFFLVKNSIIEEKVEAIVNPANERLIDFKNPFSAFLVWISIVGSKNIIEPLSVLILCPCFNNSLMYENVGRSIISNSNSRPQFLHLA